MSRLAATILLATVLAACGSAGPTGSTPSTEPSGTAASPPAPPPSTAVSPTNDPQAPSRLFVPGDALAVLAGTATVHLEADDASRAMGDLNRGEVVIVVDFPTIDAAGRLWLSVVTAGSPVPGRLPDLPAGLPEREYATTGWLMADDGSSARVGSIPPRCPAAADFQNVAAMLGSERVACFGPRSLALEGFGGCAPCGGDEGIYEPAWLAGSAQGSITDVSGLSSVMLYLPPPLVAAARGSHIRVRGHFDDPRAAACRMSFGGVDMPHDIVVELCRRHLVVESLEVLPGPTAAPLR